MRGRPAPLTAANRALANTVIHLILLQSCLYRNQILKLNLSFTSITCKKFIEGNIKKLPTFELLFFTFDLIAVVIVLQKALEKFKI